MVRNIVPSAPPPATLTPETAGKASHQIDARALSAVVQAQVSASIGRDQRAFQFSNTKSGYRLENRSKDLAVTFAQQEIAFRVGSNHWGLSLTGYGYGKKLRSAGTVAPRASENRIEYRRGDLTEWYVNGPLGLEQGFTMARAPGKSTGESLKVTLALTGDLEATVDPDRRGLTMKKKGVAVLRYAGLAVKDTAGRELPARMEASKGQLSLMVEDQRAIYPITIDPIVQVAELTASDCSEDCSLGAALAVSNDGTTLVVGAPAATEGSNSVQGAAYVFVRKGGVWQTGTEVAKLSASDGGASDAFGTAVAVSADGSTIVVTAPMNQSNQGAAYVFTKPAGGWSSGQETAKLTALDAAGGANFGRAVSISNDGATIVIGQLSIPFPGLEKGYAYIFLEPTTGWSPSAQQVKLTESSSTIGCGAAVAMSGNGNTLVLGCASSGLQSEGGFIVFTKPSSGWSTAASWVGFSGSSNPNRELGRSVAIDFDGSEIAVGSLQFLGVSVLTAPGADWSGSSLGAALLKPSDAVVGDWFGSSVAVSSDGSLVAAGAPRQTIGSNSQQGSTYLFAEPSGGWADETETQKLTASDGIVGANFGIAVGLSGDGSSIFAGADGASATPQLGQAYVFTTTSNASLSPSSLNFGFLAVGKTSTAQQVSLTNSGGSPLNVSGVSVSGGFTTTQNCLSSTPLTAGASCTENIVFAPTSLGPLTGTVTFTDDSGSKSGSTQTVPLSGSGGTPPTASINPLSLTFGNQAVGTTSSGTTVTLTNTGDNPLHVTAVSASSPALEYQTTENCVTASPLSAGASCTETVTFAPHSSGSISGTLTFSDDSGGVPPGSSQMVRLSGTGTVPTASVSPISLTFGSIGVGSKSSTQKATITNIGAAPLHISTATIAPVAPLNFTTTQNCPSTTLAPGASCSEDVAFTPISAGALSGTVTFTDDSGGTAGQSQSLTLTGTGAAVPATITLSASTPFIVPSQGVTLNATVTGTAQGTPTGSVTFMSGSTSIISIPLTVLGSDISSASITIGSSQLNLGPNSLTAVYSGDMNYAASTSPVVIVSLLQSNFGAASVGSSASQPIELQLTSAGTINSIQAVTQGVSNLDFTATSGGTCATSSGYAAGQTCTVNIAFSPTAPGARTGAVQLLDASGNALASTFIYGIGQGPAIAFAPGLVSKIGGLTNPTAAAVDAAGNLYVADSGKILRISPGCNTTSCQITIATGFATQIAAMALDGLGDLFITGDASMGSALLELSVGCHSSTCALPFGPQVLGSPNGIALDKLGNLYASDSALPYVVEIPNGCSSTACILHIGSNLNHVTGVAVDAAGNVFISAAASGSGSAAIVEFAGGGNSIFIDPNGISLNTDPQGIYSGAAGGVGVDAAGDVIFSFSGNSSATNQTFTGLLDQNNSRYAAVLGGGPYGQVVIDGFGNAFVTVLGDGVYEIQRSQLPALTFASTNIGQTSTDSPRAVQIQNIGNQPLNTVAPGILIAPGTDFAQVTGSKTYADCAPTFSLTNNQGASNICELLLSFTPSVYGPITSSLTLTDNASSSASQTINLLGTGVAATTTNINAPAPITYGASAVVTVSVTTGASGTVPGNLSLSVDDGTPQSLPLNNGSATFTLAGLPAGTHSLSANFAAQGSFLSSSASGSLQVNPAPQAISFTANAPASAGKSTSFLVAASASSGLTVVFSSSGACTNSGATFTITAATGTCSVIASQPGSNNYLLAPTVTQRTTAMVTIATVLLTSSANPSTAGKSVTFTASISGPGAAPTGKIEFLDGTTVVATKALSSGSASTSTKWLVPGNYTIKAVYTGDINYAGATSAPLLQIVNTPTTTVLASSLNPSGYNQPVSFTATVNPSAGAVPDGESVTFLHGAVVLGTAALSAGKASFITSALGTGTTNVTVTYVGDANYSGSSSTALKQVVNAAPTTTTLTASVNPSKIKQAVVFNVTITAAYGSTPNGSITIYDGTTALKTATLTNGTVGVQLSTLASGTHNLQATYKGNANFTTSTSAILVQTVQ